VAANAYGHGATPVARRLEAEGAPAMCVAAPEEGMELRRAGITIPILCLGPADPAQVAPAARSRLVLSVQAPEDLAALDQAGRAAGNPVHFHLHVDTGMGQLGLLAEDLGPFLDTLRSSRAAILSGVYSILASSDQPGDPQSAAQGQRLSAAAEEIRAAGYDPRPVHLCDSSGLLFHPALRFDAVRPGLLLYGVGPAPGPLPPGFAPALTLKTTIVRLKTVPQGTPVGYGAAWKASRETRLATLAAGYDDGLPRGAEVLVGGRRAPLVGATSMDVAVVDVTDCGPVSPGAEAVVIGSQGGENLTVRDIAERVGTPAGEVLCRIGRRVPRVHVANHSTVSVSTPLPPVKDSTLGPDPARGPQKARRAAADPAAPEPPEERPDGE